MGKHKVASHMLPNEVPVRLTKATVAKLAIPAGRSELLVFDDALPGFGIRLRAGGKRTWVVQYRLGAKQRRLSLGNVEAVDPDEARRRAKDALAKAQLGDDPQLEKHTARRQASATFGMISTRYVEDHVARKLRPRTAAEVRRALSVHWASLAEIPVGKIERASVAARLGEIAKENGGFAANRSRAYLSAFFGWAIGMGLADHNPVVGTNKATEEVSRDRVLSDEELRDIWHQAGEGDYAYIVRLLILTGQRREEVGGMLWSEINLKSGLWTIGQERTKNGRAHDLPLSGAAAEILMRRGRQDGRDLVFGSRTGSFSGYSRSKAALDARVVGAIRAKDPKAQRAPWRLHDIRRTAATRMADLGVQPHVIEAVLNHVSGSKAGVAGVYNRSSYAAEKKAALDLWGKHVERLL